MKTELLNLSPVDFCRVTDACKSGRLFAAQYKTMAEVWDNCPRIDWLCWIMNELDAAAWWAVESAAWSAAQSAAWPAARSAARSATEPAAWSAAWLAAQSAQANELRKIVPNPFKNV